MANKILRFEDIQAWQKAKELSLLVYGDFSNCRDYGFVDQIKRASVSIMNNIAEGYERKGDRQLKQFLFIAKGSAGEVRSMVVLANELGYINDGKYRELTDRAEEVSKMLSGFINKLD